MQDDLISVDVICLLEADETEVERARIWLNEKKERRLILVYPNNFSSCLGIDPLSLKIDHPQITCKSFDSPLQLKLLAREIAWESVFLKMEVLGGKGEFWELFRDELKTAHLAANLLLSDASDGGCLVARHSFLRKARPVRQGLELKSAFTNIPAIIVGAGPSLEKNGHLLEGLRNQALIFAGGSALNALQTEPHFAAAIDKEAPYREFKRHPFAETPFCFQSRMNPDNFSLVHGEAILFPDSHFQFLDEGERFEGGWTVGTFLVALATLMGCDPIIMVGMDYCYHSERKYAGGLESRPAHLVEATAMDGSRVWTQPDWLMARKWLEEWAVKHSKIRFFNATEGGMGFSSPVQEVQLSRLHFEPKDNLRKIVHKKVSELPFVSPMDWAKWKGSLERCQRSANDGLFGGVECFEGERAYDELLLPLWNLWSHVFKRALESDSHPDKLKLNRLLFFQQIIQEHLRAIN